MASKDQNRDLWGQRFRIQVVLRCLILTLVIFGFVYTLLKGQWPVSSLFLGIATVIGVINLIAFLEKSNREFKNLLEAIAHHDFTYNYSREVRGKTFADLKVVSETIMNSFRELRAEKESHYQYLQNVVEHVQVALLCFKEEEDVALMNQATRRLLNRPYLSSLKQLAMSHPELLKAIRSIRHGQRVLVKNQDDGLAPHIALQATQFKLQNVSYKLVSLQDIRIELEEKEVETWQKLIRVLTHEIMNSVTPIVSLSKVTHSLLTEENGEMKQNVENEELSDILESIQTIEARSKGLLHFVHAYRSLSQIPPPQISLISVHELLHRTLVLLGPEIEKRNIHLEVQMPEREIKLAVDPGLIEQVLINLIKNAMEAVAGLEQGHIQVLTRSTKEQQIQVLVQDNGPGIDAELVDKIFIPFFTTKNKGSGIGLSLSRQIMRLHQGNIEMKTERGRGSTFVLTFPPPAIQTSIKSLEE